MKKTTEELKRATHNSRTALEQTEVHFSPQKRDHHIGVPIRADPQKVDEENSTPEKLIGSLNKEITLRSNALEMSPPLVRYEPSAFERTFEHKLDGVTLKELEQMRIANQDRIKEIENKYFGEESKSVNVHERITAD